MIRASPNDLRTLLPSPASLDSISRPNSRTSPINSPHCDTPCHMDRPAVTDHQPTPFLSSGCTTKRKAVHVSCEPPCSNYREQLSLRRQSRTRSYLMPSHSWFH